MTSLTENQNTPKGAFWYCSCRHPRTPVYYANEMDRLRDEIERLRAALRPFADAHHAARRFLERLGENRSVMETRDMYMWYAPRHLNMDNFARAVIALGERHE